MESRSEGTTVALGSLGGGWDDEQMGEAGSLVGARGLDSGGEERGPVVVRRKSAEFWIRLCQRAQGARAEMTWKGLAGVGEASWGADSEGP